MRVLVFSYRSPEDDFVVSSPFTLQSIAFVSSLSGASASRIAGARSCLTRIRTFFSNKGFAGVTAPRSAVADHFKRSCSMKENGGIMQVPLRVYVHTYFVHFHAHWGHILCYCLVAAFSHTTRNSHANPLGIATHLSTNHLKFFFPFFCVIILSKGINRLQKYIKKSSHL